MTPSGPKIWTAISPLIAKLRYRPKAQMSEMHMAIFLVFFNFQYDFLFRPQNGSHFEIVEILNAASIWH